VRNLHHLSLEEREEISRGIVGGESLRKIAARLTRAPSTIAREIQRNGGPKRYRAIRADNMAWSRSCRPKACKLALNADLRFLVAGKLRQRWSPQQISGWLSRNYSADSHIQISHETIYKSLYIQSRGVLPKQLAENLRRKRKLRHARNHTTKGHRGSIKNTDGRTIHQRPREIDERKTIGHWEGDLVAGSGNTHLASLVERNSRYTRLVRLTGKDTETVISALIKEFSQMPAKLRKSLTWDRGMEMANHTVLSNTTDISVFFCDPKSPWQRGTNENTNGLIRQYFPRKTPLGHLTQKELDIVSGELNRRPRRILDYRTPEEVISRSVALIH
jgi:IS30 family transposase